MACYHPRRVSLDRDGQVIWKARHWSDSNRSRWVNISCNQCLGCDRAVMRDWSLRLYHEVSGRMVDWRDEDTGVTTRLPNACVVTLTYDDEHLPANGALNHEDFQRFMKRLRQHRFREHRRLGLKTPIERLSYFMCGEYGPKTKRPHFHAVLIGIVFDDTYEIVSNGKVLRCSHALDSLWSQPPTLDPSASRSRIGVATVDSFSFGGAMYVTGYVAKKATDKLLGPIEEVVDVVTGQVTIKPVQPEYRRMSTGNGTPSSGYPLGNRWLMGSGWGSKRVPCRIPDVYSQDCVTVGQWTFRPPKYYDRLARLYREDIWGDVLRKREQGAFEAASEWSESRCSAAERIALDALRQQRSSF